MKFIHESGNPDNDREIAVPVLIAKSADPFTVSDTVLVATLVSAKTIFEDINRPIINIMHNEIELFFIIKKLMVYIIL